MPRKETEMASRVTTGVVLSCTLAVLCPSVLAQTPRTTDALDGLFSAWTRATPGCAVGVASSDSTVLRACPHRRRITARPTAQFQVWHRSC